MLEYTRGNCVKRMAADAPVFLRHHVINNYLIYVG